MMLAVKFNMEAGPFIIPSVKRKLFKKSGFP